MTIQDHRSVVISTNMSSGGYAIASYKGHDLELEGGVRVGHGPLQFAEIADVCEG